MVMSKRILSNNESTMLSPAVKQTQTVGNAAAEKVSPTVKNGAVHNARAAGRTMSTGGSDHELNFQGKWAPAQHFTSLVCDTSIARTTDYI